MKKNSLSRKIVACLSSAALAVALVPAFAAPAVAEDPVLTIYIDDLDDPQDKDTSPTTFTRAQLEALAQTTPQSFVYLKSKKWNSLTAYTTSNYVPIESILGNIPAWKAGSTLTQNMPSGEYVPAAATEKKFTWPLTYEFMTAEQYFYPKLAFDQPDTSSPEIVKPCIPLTMTEAVAVSGTAEQAKGGPEVEQSAIRVLLGSRKDAYEVEDPATLGGVTHNSAVSNDIVEFVIGYHKTDVSKATVELEKTSAAYTGKVQTAAVKSVKVDGKALAEGTDYTATVATGTEVGSYEAVVTGKGICTGTAKATFQITKAANKAKAKKTSVKKTLKASEVKKKVQKISLPKVTTTFGTAKWKVTKKDKKKVLSLSGKKVKVSKKAKKGKTTYTIKLKASVKATNNYAAANTKTVTVKVKIR